MTSSRPLRIVSLNFAYYPLYGGAENQSRLLAKTLNAFGHEITVLTLRFAGTPEADNIDGIPIIRFPRRPFTRNKTTAALRAFAAAFVQLRRLRRQTDVVHLHGASFLLIPALLIKKLYRIPVVLKMASSGAAIGDVHIVRNSKLSWLKLRLLRDVDRFICLNEESAVEVKKLLPSARCLHIPNGVDCSYWSPAKSRIEHKTAMGLNEYKTAIYAGRVGVGKGVDFLLKVWKEVTCRIPKTKLFIVGDGPLLDDMRELASHLGISGQVEFVGYKQDIRTVLFAMDVFLLFSPNEGMSNALLEAMAAAVPVVCTNNSGNAMVVENMGNGLIVEAGQVPDAAEKVCQVLQQTEFAKALADRARSDVRKRFDVSVVASQYEALFSGLCRHSASSF